MPNPILDASSKIAAILAQLERDTGQLVEQIEVKSIEATSLGDDRPIWRQVVRIEMVRLPGHDWGDA